MKKESLNPIIFWEGFPVCGFLVMPLFEIYPNLTVVATKPVVPFKMCKYKFYNKIVWLEEPNEIEKYVGVLSEKNFIVFTGWRYKAWNRFAVKQKKSVGAKVVVVVDNIFNNEIKQLLGFIYFRFCLKKIYDAAFVPGRKSFEFLHYLGMPRKRIFVGNYGASELFYLSKTSAVDRKNQFLYVGQLIKRKSVDLLIEAFKRYRDLGGYWDLSVIGDGPLFNSAKIEGLNFHSFMQPNEICDYMNNSKVFCLLSRKEHWGTVLCEAAACGMNLIAYHKVGSAVDLIRNGINGKIIYQLTLSEIVNAMFYYQNLPGENLTNGSQVSIGISRAYNSSCYKSAFTNMVNEIT